MFQNQMIKEKNGDKQREKEIQNKKKNVWENSDLEVENKTDLVSKGERCEEEEEIEMRMKMKLLLNDDEDETDVEFNGSSSVDYKVSDSISILCIANVNTNYQTIFCMIRLITRYSILRPIITSAMLVGTVLCSTMLFTPYVVIMLVMRIQHLFK